MGMGTRSLGRRSNMYSSNCRDNNSNNNNGKVVVPVLLKAHQRQRLMRTSPNDEDARWRGTVRGMISIILAGNSAQSFLLTFWLSLSYANAKQVFSSFFSCGSHCISACPFIFASYGSRHCSSFSVSRVSFSSNRRRLRLFFLSFCLCLSLFITLYSHSYSSQARRASSVAYLYYQSRS